MTQDQKLISRCIELAQKALRLGDAPFGSLIADRNGKVLVEAHNAVRLKGDVTAHAEILAMRKLQKKLGKYNLRHGGYNCATLTLYTNCEPCPMCAFMARELKFGRIVYAVSSPVCGGHKRWKILKDVELLKLEPFYDAPPEVIGGVLKTEALALMRKIGWHHYFT